MAAHVNRTVAFAVTLGLLGVPAMVDALPIHFRPQTTEATLDLRDEANGVQVAAAGAGEFDGLLSNGNGAELGSGGFGGAGGGSVGNSGGASALRSGSTKRAKGTLSNARWIRGSAGSGFRSGSGWNDSNLILLTTVLPVTNTNTPVPALNGKIPEPATAILFGSAIAFLSIRRLRRHK
jgi:hypothetical protein